MKKLYKLLYYEYWLIPKKLKIYFKLLKSDKHFTEEDYKYFGKRIYDLRVFEKQVKIDILKSLTNIL